jgi:hypothetical protein
VTSGFDLRLWNLRFETSVPLRHNERSASSQGGPYRLRGMLDKVDMISSNGDVFFELPMPFEEEYPNTVGAMYSKDERYVIVPSHSRKFPVDAEEIMRLVNIEKIFGNISTREEIEPRRIGK